MHKPQVVSIWRVTLVSEVNVELTDDVIELRIEVLRSNSNGKLFMVRVWRLESYRLQSTFPQRRGRPAHEPSDEIILKEFEGFESVYREPRRAESARSVERAVHREVRRWARSLG